MFKRPHLRPTSLLVNAGLATSMIFLAACGSDNEATSANSAANSDASAPASAPNDDANPAILQAVWTTKPLAEPITSLAFVGGAEPILAVSLETGALQLFNIEGDRITEPAALDVQALATGQAVVLNEAALTLFPGISTGGDINLYAYASALGDPIKLDFLPDTSAAGLCAGPPLDGTSLMQLAYWTSLRPAELIHGHVQQDASGELLWSPLDTLNSANGPITACLADARLQVATKSTAVNLALLAKFGERFLLAQTAQGNVNVITANGETKPATINDGITVSAPKPATALAALSVVKFGAYPNGVIVLGGAVNGDSVITFIEPEALFESKR